MLQKQERCDDKDRGKEDRGKRGNLQGKGGNRRRVEVYALDAPAYGTTGGPRRRLHVDRLGGPAPATRQVPAHHRDPSLTSSSSGCPVRVAPGLAASRVPTSDSTPPIRSAGDGGAKARPPTPGLSLGLGAALVVGVGA